MPDGTSLIVNADDFGMSAGVNRGLVHAYEHGIVTSASLMVRRPGAAEAAAYARAHPRLSLGLHIDLGQRMYRDGELLDLYRIVPLDDSAAVAEQVVRQVDSFRQLVGQDPTHLDSHQHVHRLETVGPAVAELARELGVPLRQCNEQVRFSNQFYGQAARGIPIPGRITVDHLVEILEGLAPGTTELMCHPGQDENLEAMYRTERFEEVNVLCDPKVRATIVRQGIELRSFHNPPGGRWEPSRYEVWSSAG